MANANVDDKMMPSPDEGSKLSDSVVDFGRVELSWMSSTLDVSAISQDKIKKQTQLVNKLKRAKALATSRNALSGESSKTSSVMVESSKPMMEMVCSEHQLKMSSFCLEDSLMVCLKCLLYGEHKGHESLDLDEKDSRDKLKKIQKDNLQSFVRKMEEASEVTRQELKECFLRMMSDIKVELDKVELIKSTELDTYLKTQILEMQENVQAQKFSCNVELPSVEIKIGSIRISSSNTILQINLPQIVFNGQDIAKLKEDPVHHHLNDVLKKSNTNEVELYTVSSSSSKNSLSNVKDEEVVEEARVCTSVDVDGLHITPVVAEDKSPHTLSPALTSSPPPPEVSSHTSSSAPSVDKKPEQAKKGKENVTPRPQYAFNPLLPQPLSVSSFTPVVAEDKSPHILPSAFSSTLPDEPNFPLEGLNFTGLMSDCASVPLATTSTTIVSAATSTNSSSREATKAFGSQSSTLPAFGSKPATTATTVLSSENKTIESVFGGSTSTTSSLFGGVASTTASSTSTSSGSDSVTKASTAAAVFGSVTTASSVFSSSSASTASVFESNTAATTAASVFGSTSIVGGVDDHIEMDIMSIVRRICRERKEKPNVVEEDPIETFESFDVRYKPGYTEKPNKNKKLIDVTDELIELKRDYKKFEKVPVCVIYKYLHVKNYKDLIQSLKENKIRNVWQMASRTVVGVQRIRGLIPDRYLNIKQALARYFYLDVKQQGYVPLEYYWIPRCYKCLQFHDSRLCNATPRCYRCRERGHYEADCTQPIRCFLCNEAGHYQEECPNV